MALIATALLADPAGELAAAQLSDILGVNPPSNADVAFGVAVPRLTKRPGGRVGVAPLRSQSRHIF